MNHEMKLHDEPFKKIMEGTKTVELRLYDVKRRALKVGDEIEFTNRLTDEKLDVIITNLKTFKDFSEVYKIYDSVAMGYNKDDIPKFEDMYKYYSKDEIEKYGVVAIEMRLK